MHDFLILDMVCIEKRFHFLLVCYLESDLGRKHTLKKFLLLCARQCNMHLLGQNAI